MNNLSHLSLAVHLDRMDTKTNPQGLQNYKVTFLLGMLFIFVPNHSYQRIQINALHHY